MRISIFQKLFASFLLMFLVIGGMSVGLLRTYRRLAADAVSVAQSSSEMIDAARVLQLDFKWQVQEWKNLLLRGHDPEEFDKYAAAFLQQADNVRKQINLLEKLDISSSNRAVLLQFSTEHQLMLTRYLEGVDKFRAAHGVNYREIDAAVKGMDRTPTDLLDSFVNSVQADMAQYQADMTQRTRQTFYLTGGLLSATFCAMLLLSLLAARSFSRPVKQLSGIFSQIAQGNVRVTFPKAGNDEVGELVASSKEMVAYLQNATELTRRIAQNDWQAQATPKSEHDVLNQSLDAMIRTLRQMQDDNIRTMAALEEQNRAIVSQNWHKEGIGQLNAALAQEMSLAALCNLAVQTVARYVQAGRGVLYLYRAETRTLELQGTFAFTEHDALKNTCQSGEGILGQVAAEQRAIYLKHLPVEQSLILTGTTYDAPLNTYTVPLIYNAKLCGVMEIASFELFGAREQAFFDEAGQVIAIRLFSIMQREQMREFFQQPDNRVNL